MKYNNINKKKNEERIDIRVPKEVKVALEAKVKELHTTQTDLICSLIMGNQTYSSKAERDATALIYSLADILPAIRNKVDEFDKSEIYKNEIDYVLEEVKEYVNRKCM